MIDNSEVSIAALSRGGALSCSFRYVGILADPISGYIEGNSLITIHANILYYSFLQF